MKTVNVHEAKTHLSKLLARVERGERVIIARAGMPVAELRPLGSKEARRHFGEAVGRVRIAEDFNAPLSGEILDAFER